MPENQMNEHQMRSRTANNSQVTASIIAVLTHSALQDCQDFCGA
jgi:hypothetical protein